MKKITKTALKKQLQTQSQGELIDLVLRLYSTVPEAVDYINIEYGGEEYAHELLSRAKRRVRNEFFPARGMGRLSLSTAKATIRDFGRVCRDPAQYIDLQLPVAHTEEDGERRMRCFQHLWISVSGRAPCGRTNRSRCREANLPDVSGWDGHGFHRQYAERGGHISAPWGDLVQDNRGDDPPRRKVYGQYAPAKELSSRSHFKAPGEEQRRTAAVSGYAALEKQYARLQERIQTLETAKADKTFRTKEAQAFLMAMEGFEELSDTELFNALVDRVIVGDGLTFVLRDGSEYS